MRSHLSMLLGALLLIGAVNGSCSTAPTDPLSTRDDEAVRSYGSIEVTARLVEIPAGAIFKRDLYNYATVLKYETIRVHRGDVIEDQTVYVGHYNPFLPRGQVADQRVKQIGGNLKIFQPGQLHRMALEVPIDDHYMGGIVNKYFDQRPEPIYWAVWTNLAGD